MAILVLGATGNVGPHVVSSLTALGVTPRVLVRDADRARTLLGDDVEVIAGDVTEPGVLAAAIDGVDSVFLLSPHSFAMADLQLGVIRALRRTGIRIVKLSGTSSAITPDGPYACREHWEIERVLHGSGQPFVILRPNSFMQVLVGQLMMSALRATGTVVNPIGTAGISLIDARDVGAVAARVLTRPDWDGQTLASDRTATARLRRTRRAGVRSHRRPRDRRRCHPRPGARLAHRSRHGGVGGRPLPRDVRTVPGRRIGVRHRHGARGHRRRAAHDRGVPRRDRRAAAGARMSACLPCDLESADAATTVFRDDTWSCDVADGYDVPGMVHPAPAPARGGMVRTDRGRARRLRPRCRSGSRPRSVRSPARRRSTS